MTNRLAFRADKVGKAQAQKLNDGSQEVPYHQSLAKETSVGG